MFGLSWPVCGELRRMASAKYKKTRAGTPAEVAEWMENELNIHSLKEALMKGSDGRLGTSRQKTFGTCNFASYLHCLETCVRNLQ